MDLRRRAIPLTVDVSTRRLRRLVFSLARSLSEGDTADAAELMDELRRDRWRWVPDEDGEAAPSPYLRAVSLCSILLDLYDSSWRVSVEGGQIYLLAPRDPEPGESLTPEELLAAKDRVRRAALTRVRAQLEEIGSGRLVRRLEGGGVHRLIADGSALSSSLRAQGAGAIKPYLQLASRSSGDDEYTGLPLYEIFRYFRFTWSFPYKDVPGRSLPILIRDAGQPDHPVCGLLCLSSPVLRLGARDAYLGLTPDCLEAMVVLLTFELSPGADLAALSRHIKAHLSAVALGLSAHSSREREALKPQRLLRAAGELLGVSAPPRPRPLARQLASLGVEELCARQEVALERIARALIDELREAIEGYDLSRLPVSIEQLMQSPGDCIASLTRFSEDAVARRTRLLTERQKLAARADAEARLAWGPLMVLSGEIEEEDLDNLDELAAASKPRRRDLHGAFLCLRDEQPEEARAAWVQRCRPLLDRAIKQLEASEQTRSRAGALGGEAGAALFDRKRAAQLATLLPAWQEVQPLSVVLSASAPRLDRLRDALRDLVSSHEASGTQISGGDSVRRGARDALLQRKTRLLASQILDVSLCGALPPYGPLLGGKLAAMLVLSREAAAIYSAVYAGRASEIQSRLAGAPVVRPTDLLALTTTGFYGVGSAQYSRIRLPAELGGLRWERAGLSQGFGTLHFSPQTSESLNSLMVQETGMRHVNSRFGEGPSERLRKLRDGLSLLGLSAEDLLRHGMSRVVYVARLQDGLAPEEPAAPGTHAEHGPAAEDIISYWRSRWLSPRISSTLAELQNFNRQESLLSARYPEQLARSWAADDDSDEE